ncbi:MAG: aminotransferase class I/II-fold pyridoxal phosphate-dependent enzyme [Nitrosomonas sp.]|uniref:aminotransferase class I/II-fold pyridoxal phosphate-dependent enzyme n=1 Tax=Nitrosomonas sp. TaxID=42353 RepID=UPI002733B4BF|nr:aminotransferase class I/II-fold pyridoxal phosphate-dependent enzyme [Nitrosomonas sp.]MDP3280676.1 aminotransferase class I/II-fold pyridoxal phosphate-dependent enzyme [Nitrosomonas sp.]MDP3663354.1 aminotransferase class I/II-fold pyridoxal phosphate-dependent enzyme [Nitrosomonas sp.]MDZ4107924.1 aminotransferase class I/II-fold pyridoxal phosphate-dependent enzyme [Nitrosomonas sp.]
MDKVKDLSDVEKRLLLKQLLSRNEKKAAQLLNPLKATQASNDPTSFNDFSGFKMLQEQAEIFQTLALKNPYFCTHEGISDHVTAFEGRKYINYSGYNYLGLSGHPEVSAAAKNAIDHYGTSVSASRIVSGEIPLHAELEQVLAEIHDTEAAVALVSGYATNVSVISHLFGAKDLILHDALIHNSVITGCILSGAKRLVFPHNDWEALDQMLKENRHNHERVLIIIEGVYSMDGDIPDLPRFIEIKKQHQCLLMVDEAHAAGVIGPRGYGSHDHFGIKGSDVDIWMGTLSKSFASCGGYICGSRALIENLKYNAAGAILFSVGISPANTAAALAAARILQREPERAARLRARSKLFIERAQANQLDIGDASGTGVIPIITGNSVLCLKLGQYLSDAGIYVHPILYPAVSESAARLRFFITCNLTEDEVIHTVDTLAAAMHKLEPN